MRAKVASPTCAEDSLARAFSGTRFNTTKICERRVSAVNLTARRKTASTENSGGRGRAPGHARMRFREGSFCALWDAFGQRDLANDLRAVFQFSAYSNEFFALHTPTKQIVARVNLPKAHSKYRSAS